MSAEEKLAAIKQAFARYTREFTVDDDVGKLALALCEVMSTITRIVYEE